MLSHLRSYFSANQVAINGAPNHPSSKPASDTTPLIFSAAPQKKSAYRLSNDVGHVDPCAPPAQSFQLRSAKIPRQLEASFHSSAISSATVSKIREESKSHYYALSDTETLFLRDTYQAGRAKTTMETLLQGSEFAKMINRKTGGFLDPSTGLHCQLRPLDSDKNTYALCIPGITSGKTFLPQLRASAKQFLGVGDVPKIYSQTLELTRFLNEKLKQEGIKLELAGHSMGGGIANYVGLMLGLPSKCFNAAALGRACLKHIGEISGETLETQIHIRLENDFATHPPVTRKLMAFFSMGKEKYVPRNVGVICEIKTGDKYYPSELSLMDRHRLDAMDNWYKQGFFSHLAR